MVILDRPAQDNNTLCAPVQRILSSTYNHGNQLGMTLTELLVTITVIAALALLTMPAWSKFTRTHACRGAIPIVMGTLEQTRLASTSGQKEVWVVFRHSGNGGKDAMRIITRSGDGFAPVGTWISLPAGVSFQKGTGGLMDEQPPANIMAQAIKGGVAQSGSTYGALMFQRTGRIGIPKQDGNTLSLSLCSSAPKDTETILLSRGTGRATLK